MEEKVRLKDGREGRGFELMECLSSMATDWKNQDCKLRCKEGQVVSGVRVLLALAFPSMMKVLKERGDEEEELVLILPDFNAEEVRTRMDDLFKGKIKLEVPVKSEQVEVGEDGEEEVDEDTADLWCNLELEDIPTPDTVHNGDTTVDTFAEIEDHYEDVETEFKIGEDDTICPYCGSEFSVTSSLKKHVSLKHKKANQDSVSSPIQCRECSLMVTSRAALYTHMSRKHPEIIVKKKALRKTKKQGAYLCDFCDHVCHNKADLTKHKKGVHGETGVTCDDCGKSLCDKATLAKHRGTRNCLNGTIHYVGKFRTNCSFCAIDFPSTEEYQDHRPLHRKGKLWKCLESNCGKTFELPRILRYHMKKHRGEFSHTCTQCGKKLVTKKGFEVHLKMHKGEFNYSCDDCGKRFVREKHFQQHQLSHKPPSFACDQCGNMYIDKPRLKRHMRAKHLMDENGKRIERKIEELMCHLCSWTIRTKWGKEALTKHIKRKHLGIVFPTYPTRTPPKLLTCQNCGYITDSSNQLRAHQASSRCDPNKLLNKSFRCSKCNKGFTTEKSLHKHEQEHITGKPHKCDNCGLGFTERWNLTKHIRKGTCKGARGSREHDIYAN